MSDWLSKTPIVAFVDNDEGGCEPEHVLRHRAVQIIIASTPKGASSEQTWMKQLGDNTSFTSFATNLWSPEELLLTGLVLAFPLSTLESRLIRSFRIFLYPHDIRFKLLRESTTYFGYDPRRCFNASHSADRLRISKSRLLEQIKDIANGTIDVMRELQSARTGASTVSHSVFQIFPANEKRLLGDCYAECVSQWALDNLLIACEDREHDAAARLYYSLSDSDWAVSFRGRLFERQVLQYLDGIHNDCDLRIRGLTDSFETEWNYRGHVPRFTFRESTVVAEINKAVANQTPLHLVPSALNFPVVNSFVYKPGDVITCVQVSISPKHPITTKGFEQMQNWLKLNTPLADLRPTTKKPWRLIFIVPSHVASTFTLQVYKDDTATGIWAKKVNQYVLGLEEETIFGRRPGLSVNTSQQGNQQVRCWISVFEHC